MKISSLLIGFTFFTMIILVGSNLLFEANRVNPAFIDSAGYQSFNAVFNRQDKINSTLANIQASLQHKEPSLLDPVNLIYNSAIFLVQSIYNSLSFVYTMFYDIPTVLGFSSEMSPFIWGILGAFTIAVVLAIISATLYREL